MSSPRLISAILLLLIAAPANGQEMTELSCSDFRPTADALRRFPELQGACLGVVEMNGELYAEFEAVVRRATNQRVVLYIPAVDRTMEVEPKPDARVKIEGQARKVRPRELKRGQSLTIHMSISELAEPVIDEIALISESNLILEHDAVPISALPSTASPWPALVLLGGLLLGAGGVIRAIRR